MKWAEMTSRQKDRLIAEKIMGYTVREHGEYDGGFAHVEGVHAPAFYLFDAQGNADWRKECTSEIEAWFLCPHYTTDMNVAWQVLQKMSTRHNEQAEFLDEPFAQFTDELLPNSAGEIWTAYQCMAREVARWTPEKICLAALKACGEDIE